MLAPAECVKNGCSDLVPGSYETRDTKTISLTSTEDYSARLSSTVSAQSDDMSSFYSARDRFERINLTRLKPVGSDRVRTPKKAISASWRSGNGIHPILSTPSTPASEISDRSTQMLPSIFPNQGESYPFQISAGGLQNPHQMNTSKTLAPGPQSGHTMPYGGTHLGSFSPGSVYPSEEQLNVAYGYGIQRDDGYYTRLLRADELEPIQGISCRQGPEGLIILPTLRQPSPPRWAGNTSTASIDGHSLNMPRRGVQLNRNDSTQLAIDTILAQSSSTPSSSPSSRTRREKIYCDKWVHEGTCAFTQIGCKYKHEMPLDKATQLSLGLNHGIPAWYRRANSVQPYPEACPSPPATRSRIAGPWRRADSTLQRTGISTSDMQVDLAPRSSFGPIGPPLRQTGRQPQFAQQFGQISSNPYFMLEHSSENEEDIRDGEIGESWPGRRR